MFSLRIKSYVTFFNSTAPSINPKGVNGGNIPMDLAIQRRPLPSVPAQPVDDDRDSTIIARNRIKIQEQKPLGQVLTCNIHVDAF